MQRMLIGFVVVGILLVAGVWFFVPQKTEISQENQKAVWVNADENMIKLDLIRPGNTVLQKFIVSGEARGPWFFEASFPVEVLDKDGKQLTIVAAQASGEWMTEAFVPFRAALDLGSYRGPATLVLHKENPSGEPERDASVSFPVVVFDPNNAE